MPPAYACVDNSNTIHYSDTVKRVNLDSTFGSKGFFYAAFRIFVLPVTLMSNTTKLCSRYSQFSLLSRILEIFPRNCLKTDKKHFKRFYGCEKYKAKDLNDDI